jgi:glycosyltransferase involved in cell wall biosynthesis
MTPPPKKLRILHVLYSLNVGGMESRVCRLARGLDPAAHDITLLTLRSSGMRQLEVPAHVGHHHLEIPPGLHLGRLLALAAYIRKGRFDIVHTHNWGSMLYGLLAGLLAGTRVLIHGEHGLDLADSQGVSGKRRTAQRLLARLAKRLVAVNWSIARHLERDWRVPARKIVTLPNGVDLARYRPAPPPSGPFTVGNVGRHDAVKNIPCLVKAFAILAGTLGPGKARLILVGSSHDTDAVKTLCADLGVASDVEFAGDTDRPEAWYSRFHVYANTSIYEGMSNTILEAMACGLPVVASGVDGNRDWLREGENALFFPSGDAEALAARLDRLRTDADLMAAMSRNNRLRAEREFDNRGFLTQYAEIYRSCFRAS